MDTVKHNDMPLKIPIKFFQPLSELVQADYFTTKPVGPVTGLGLGLSYDIVNTHIKDLKEKSTSEKVLF